MERRDFLKSLGILGLLAIGGCAQTEQKDTKQFVTSLNFGDHRFLYVSSVYSLPEVSKTTTFGWIGRGKGPLYKDSGDGIMKGPLERVYFAFNTFRPVCTLTGPVQKTDKLVYSPMEERFTLRDKPLLSQPSGKLTAFRLEDDLSLSPQIYLTYDQPVLKDEHVQAWNIWKVDGDSMVASPQKELGITLGSIKGLPIAYLYEEFLIKAENI